MFDLHCHLLPGVDDGSPDLAQTLAIARALAEFGFTHVAPSPHFGEGPGGDVARDLAASKRHDVAEALRAEGIALELLPNAEHHITTAMYTRLANQDCVPLGGAGHWLLVELPWQSIPNPEDVLFRLQLRGHRLLLAHPERYSYLDVEAVVRLVERGVRMQIELGSFAGVYGQRAESKARALMQQGAAHVLATDLHRAKDAEEMLRQSRKVVHKQFGEDVLRVGLEKNPQALLRDLEADDILPVWSAD